MKRILVASASASANVPQCMLLVQKGGNPAIQSTTLACPRFIALFFLFLTLLLEVRARRQDNRLAKAKMKKISGVLGKTLSFAPFVRYMMYEG